MLVQAITSCARDAGQSLTMLSADKLRKALLAAGNIVKPEEVTEALSYVTQDGQYKDLDGLYLVHLRNGSIQKIQRDSNRGKKYFVFTDAESEAMYKLMEGNQHQLVESSSAWNALSR